MTLVDISSEMLAVSQKLNPKCEHVRGDMRTVRLDRKYDAVFIHDAIDYMTTASDLRSAIDTAYYHCKPGGVALFAPDHTLETFHPSTRHGGSDRGDRSLRYLEWTWERNPQDNTYITLMVYQMRQGKELVGCVEECHSYGLFSKDDWLKFLIAAGFKPRSLLFEYSSVEFGSSEIFLGIKP